MAQRTRQLQESPVTQGVDEKLAYWFNTATWSDTPITPTAAIYDISTGVRTDVTATCMTGSATLAGTIYTGPYVYALTAGNVYQVEYKFYDGANIFEAYAIINAEN
jgi:hypothetical protein